MPIRMQPSFSAVADGSASQKKDALVVSFQSKMVKRTLVRSISEGNLSDRPVCQYHRPRPHLPADFVPKKSNGMSNYGSSESWKRVKEHGSYWSPAVSEHSHPLPPAGLNRRIQLSRLIFFLIQTSLVISTTTLVNLPDRSAVILAGYLGAAFLAAIFAPVIFSKWSELPTFLFGGISVVFYAAATMATSATSTTTATSATSTTSAISELWILLPVGVVCGFFGGLVVVQQGLSSLKLGLQHGCLQSVKKAKKNAGHFFLWTEVVVKCGGLLGSIVWSAYSKPRWNFNVPDRVCGGGACWPLFSAVGTFLPSLNNWTVGAEAKYAKQTAVIDQADHQANMLRGLTAAALGLTAVLCAGLWSFCFDSSGTRRRFRNAKNDVPVEEELLSVLSGDASEIFNESPIRQCYNLLSLLLYDHKLQTLLPLAFFTGMQNSFILTAFAKDFVGCALGKDFVGWTSATYFGAFALSLWIIYHLSQQSKRLYILAWIVLFQFGIGIVVVVWLPGSHDVPMFFIIAAVFGVVEGGLTALLSGLLVRIFAHDWTGTYSWIVALRLSGSTAGICSGIFLCTTAQTYLLCAVLVMALVPYWILEWKYSRFLHRKSSIKEEFI